MTDEEEQQGLQALGRKTLHWIELDKQLIAVTREGGDMEQKKKQRNNARSSMLLSGNTLLSKGVQP